MFFGCAKDIRDIVPTWGMIAWQCWSIHLAPCQSSRSYPRPKSLDLNWIIWQSWTGNCCIKSRLWRRSLFRLKRPSFVISIKNLLWFRSFLRVWGQVSQLRHIHASFQRSLSGAGSWRLGSGIQRAVVALSCTWLLHGHGFHEDDFCSHEAPDSHSSFSYSVATSHHGKFSFFQATWTTRAPLAACKCNTLKHFPVSIDLPTDLTWDFPALVPLHFQSVLGAIVWSTFSSCTAYQSLHSNLSQQSVIWHINTQYLLWPKANRFSVIIETTVFLTASHMCSASKPSKISASKVLDKI